jgi:deazaflavin-dependent oxidoreductase (nitroreductase family)
MTEQNSQHSLSNRLFMKIAGRRFRAYSIVTHIGRRSGREYRNPVGAYPLGDGFVLAILYGPESQWVRNVMASGGFTLRTKGYDYQLERPEVIPSSQALAAYPRLWQWTLKRQKVDAFVWAHRRMQTVRIYDSKLDNTNEERQSSAATRSFLGSSRAQSPATNADPFSWSPLGSASKRGHVGHRNADHQTWPRNHAQPRSESKPTAPNARRKGATWHPTALGGAYC